MKKLTLMMLILTLLCSVSFPCAAEEPALTLSDTMAQPGETIYITVTLIEPVVANTIGITYTYDQSMLEAVPASCSWTQKGVLQDFDKNGSGVWAAKTAQELQGSLCVLAFRILPDAKFTKTTVSATVLLKNDASEVGSYTAEAVISQGCEHTYGDWSDLGPLGHSCSCTICNSSLTESHSWDSGVRSQKKEDPHMDLMTYTCTVCGGTNVIEIPAEHGQSTPTEPVVPEPVFPTKPAETEPYYPTAPRETEPSREEHDHTGNQGSSGNQGNSGNQNNGSQNSTNQQGGQAQSTRPYQDYNTGSDKQPNEEAAATKPYQDYNSNPGSEENASNGNVETDEHAGHDHGNTGNAADPHSNTTPMAVPAVPNDETNEASADVHDHDHDHTVELEERGDPAVNAVIIFSLLAAAIGAAVYYVKKKH